MPEQRESARAGHGDVRLQERRQRCGDLAELTVDELQQSAAQQGLEDRSRMDKDELLEALSGRNG